MSDKAKVMFYIDPGEDGEDEEPLLVVYVQCPCGQKIEESRLWEDSDKSWIIECPDPECHRRYQVGVIEVEEL
jgi:hypothetical protein